jgi:AhpD family alkylhydroperoxidase
MGQESRSVKFTETLGEGVDNSFKKLAAEILKERALSVKDKAIIGLACAVAIRCEYCIKNHQQSAMRAGATKDELMEATAVAALVRLGSGLNAAAVLLDNF